MKKIFTTLVTVFTVQMLFATTVLTVKEQLENLNQFWKDKNFSDPILQERILMTDDVTLIQTHLSLVEQKLRSKNTNYLSTAQQLNREKCLNILHDYWTKGIFPKNTHHSKRTPYFIDDIGTACAVGQLIISTGYGDFAKQISKENNYAYIKELNQKYPEIKKWAEENGFEIDELAWIQPCYACTYYCNTGQHKNVSCYGGSDGCDQPDFTTLTAGLTPPFTYQFQTCSATWTCGAAFCIASCDLTAGNYRWEVQDALGYIRHYDFTITQPDSIKIIPSSTNDNGSCNGTATATVTGGVGSYTYSWSTSPVQTTQTATGLCQGQYTVSVHDTNNCLKQKAVTVNSSVGIDEISLRISMSVQPNPFHKTCALTTNAELKNAELRIYNQLGTQVSQQKVNSQTTIINRDGLANGIYFYQLINGDGKLATGRMTIE